MTLHCVFQISLWAWLSPTHKKICKNNKDPWKWRKNENKNMFDFISAIDDVTLVSNCYELHFADSVFNNTRLSRDKLLFVKPSRESQTTCHGGDKTGSPFRRSNSARLSGLWMGHWNNIQKVQKRRNESLSHSPIEYDLYIYESFVVSKCRI